MQGDGSDISYWGAENLDRKDLLWMWKSLTHTLISTGHVAELHQELDHASRTGCEDINGQWAIESVHVPALLSKELLQAATNSTDNDRLAWDNGDEESIERDTVMSTPGESEINDVDDDDDDDDDDICDIPSNFIAEAAALPPYHSQPQSFEDIFAQEESLLSCDGLDDVIPSSGRSSTAETRCPRAYAPASSPSLSLSNSEQEQWIRKGPSQHIPIQSYIWGDTEGQDSIVKGAGPPRSTSSPRKTARTIDTGRLRLSDKKDLGPSEISVVAQRLIKNDSVIYFLNNCRLIYENLIPSLVQQPLVSQNNSIKESVIAAFDTIQGLVNGKEIHRLLLRFAYIHLVRVIDIYRAAAAKDRVEGQLSRGVGQRDITVAIDMYLAAKKKVSRSSLSRTKLLDYCRRGKRWSFLAGPSPISVFVFSRAADTIVYVPPFSSTLSRLITSKGRTILLRIRLSRCLRLKSGTIIPSLLLSWSKLASIQAWLPQAQH
jgi:hypothetical protein